MIAASSFLLTPLSEQGAFFLCHAAFDQATPVGQQMIVFSFSKADDDLAQWRSYADDGCGYVLGFDTRLLEHAFAETAEAKQWGCSTFKVTYDDAKLAEIQRGMINVVFPHVCAVKGMGLSPETRRLFCVA